ncbi:MAG: alpha/beta fold hydrolase [Sphingobacteriaceae bacterium]|nr:MAG: alpha/beta fold hydrolase [Sphingobacteriaceae bacterium]
MSSKSLNPNWLDHNLFPFTSKAVEIDGSTIHYIDEGNGPILLLLHGNPTWSFLYRHIVAKLKSHFRCIALDYPGFGLSTAKQGYNFTPREHSQIVEKFVDLLSLKNIAVMVQDWGGPIGLGFAARKPELIHSLIIGNTFAWSAEHSIGLGMFSWIFGSRFMRFLITRFNLLAKWLIPAGTNRKLTEKELAAYMGPFLTPESRLPTWIFSKEILRSKNYLIEVLL